MLPCCFVQVVAFVLISLAAFGNYSAYIVDFSLFGGIIACGAFLLMIAVVGLVATMLHHQVTLFFVSLRESYQELELVIVTKIYCKIFSA